MTNRERAVMLLGEEKVASLDCISGVLKYLTEAEQDIILENLCEDPVFLGIFTDFIMEYYLELGDLT